MSQRIASDEACPHCGARAGALPSDDGAFQCALCGGPRIVVEPPVNREGSERALLVEAASARRRRAAWGAGAGVATAAAALGSLGAAVWALAADPGVLGWSVLGALSVGPALLAWFGWRQTSRHAAEARHKLRAAEEQAAAEVLRVRGDVEPAELARMMHVSEERAYELLAHGEVAGLLLDGAPARRVRVDDGGVDEEESPDEARGRRAHRAP